MHATALTENAINLLKRPKTSKYVFDIFQNFQNFKNCKSGGLNGAAAASRDCASSPRVVRAAVSRLTQSMPIADCLVRLVTVWNLAPAAAGFASLSSLALVVGGCRRPQHNCKPLCFVHPSSIHRPFVVRPSVPTPVRPYVHPYVRPSVRPSLRSSPS